MISKALFYESFAKFQTSYSPCYVQAAYALVTQEALTLVTNAVPDKVLPPQLSWSVGPRIIQKFCVGHHALLKTYQDDALFGITYLKLYC